MVYRRARQVGRLPEVKAIVNPTQAAWRTGTIYIPYNFRSGAAHLVPWRSEFTVEVAGKVFEGRRLDPSYRLGVPRDLLLNVGNPGDPLLLVARPGLLSIESGLATVKRKSDTLR